MSFCFQLQLLSPKTRELLVTQGARGDKGDQGDSGALTEDERASVAERFKGARAQPGKCLSGKFPLECSCNVWPPSFTLLSFLVSFRPNRWLEFLSIRTSDALVSCGVANDRREGRHGPARTGRRAGITYCYALLFHIKESKLSMALHPQGPKGEPGVKGEKGDPNYDPGEKVRCLFYKSLLH